MPAFDPTTALTPEALYAGVATDLVERFAPEPAVLPVPDDYTPRQQRAQQLVYDYLRQTKGGVLSSKGSTAGVTASKSYAVDMKPVKAIVKGVMGAYYVGDRLKSVAILSSFPR